VICPVYVPNNRVKWTLTSSTGFFPLSDNCAYTYDGSKLVVGCDGLVDTMEFEATYLPHKKKLNMAATKIDQYSGGVEMLCSER